MGPSTVSYSCFTRSRPRSWREDERCGQLSDSGSLGGKYSCRMGECRWPRIISCLNLCSSQKPSLSCRAFLPWTSSCRKVSRDHERFGLSAGAPATPAQHPEALNALETFEASQSETWWQWRNLSLAAAVGITIGLLLSENSAHAHAVTASVSMNVDPLLLDDLRNGFASAFLLIFFSEIGDKTFFIAALLASRQNNAAVFSGTFGALALMTIISVGLGRFFHYLDEFLPVSLGEMPLPLDDMAAVVLLVYFGLTTLADAASMEGSKAADEKQEAELAIAGLGSDGSGAAALVGTAAATFALVFVAEWGDKSFFSTIALAAASSPVGVVTGAVAGHGIATLIAVLGGSFLATYISEKAVAYTGGILFLVFAGLTVGEIIDKLIVF